MNTHPQDDGYSFTVGDSRLGALPQQIRRALAFPGASPLIKEENSTFIWRLKLTLPGQGEGGVVKLYRRRSWRHQSLRCFRRVRVQREFSALCVLADAGVPCSAPLLWGWGTAPEHGRFELIVTREIAGAINLKERLARGEQGLGAEELLPLFGVVRHMHESGVYHGALSPKNILAVARSGGGYDFHLIDLARAVCFPGAVTGTPMAWFDLLSLIRRLVQLRSGLDCEKCLLKYGLPKGEIGGFLARLKRFRPTRHTRNWLALRFRLRAGIARAFG